MYIYILEQFGSRAEPNFKGRKFPNQVYKLEHKKVFVRGKLKGVREGPGYRIVALHSELAISLTM